MTLIRSIPSKISDEQMHIVFRDICRSINYAAGTKDVAQTTLSGMECSSEWKTLPECVSSVGLQIVDGELQLQMQTDDSELAGTQSNALADNLEDTLSSFFNYETQAFPTKVFCVGWSKTGTTSLAEAFRILGLFTWQCAPWTIGINYYSSDISDISIDFSALNDYTAAADLPICALYPELDKQFPGSKFILTTRPEDKWVDSAIHQLNELYDSHGEIGAIARWGYGADKIDRDILLQRYRQHNQQVLDYFKNRSDLLVLDMDEDNQWNKLCSFLNLPEPDCAYPYLNKRKNIFE